MKDIPEQPFVLSPTGITLVYALVGCLWIMASDHVASLVFSEPEAFAVVQTLKGWFYVILTAALLFFLTRAMVKRWQRERERLRAYIDQASDMFIEVREDGSIEEVNTEICQVLGYTRGEMIGESVGLIDNEAGLQDRNIWQQILKDGDLLIESNLQRKDGSEIPVEIHVSRAEIMGKMRGLAWIRDVTRRRQQGEEARHLQNELARTLRLGTMGEMASGLAHELNQPLTAIRIYANGIGERLQKGEISSEDAAQIMDRIANEAQRASEIIRHIREFVAKRPPKTAEIDISSITKKCVDLLASEARHAQVEVCVSCAPDLSKVLADEVSIQQVLINLLRNGIEAISDRAQQRIVNVDITQTETEIRVSISDTGQGMSPEVREHLFEPFYAARPSGTGIGLSICRTIIEALGGKLAISSEEGHGTNALFTLPIAGSPPTNP